MHNALFAFYSSQWSISVETVSTFQKFLPGTGMAQEMQWLINVLPRLKRYCTVVGDILRFDWDECATARIALPVENILKLNTKGDLGYAMQFQDGVIFCLEYLPPMHRFSEADNVSSPLAPALNRRFELVRDGEWSIVIQFPHANYGTIQQLTKRGWSTEAEVIIGSLLMSIEQRR